MSPMHKTRKPRRRYLYLATDGVCVHIVSAIHRNAAARASGLTVLTAKQGELEALVRKGASVWEAPA